MINSLRKFSNIFFGAKFTLNYPKAKTILLIEVNNYHTELLPSFVHYIKGLGFNVEIMANFGQIGNLPKMNTENIYYFTLSGFKRALASNKIKDYSHLIFLSNEIFWSFGGKKEPKQSVFDKFKINHTKISAVLHDLGEKTPPAGVRKIVMTNFLKKEDMFRINPCYFKDTLPKEKNKKTVFITTGKLENIRKNSDLLFNGVKKLLNNGVNNFEVRIIGNNTPDTVPKELRGNIKTLGRLGFDKMYEELNKADFFLPLLDIENKSHKRYITTGTSGSFQIIRGFLLPPVIQKEFCAPHGFFKGNAMIYEKDFPLALKKCIDMENGEYLALLEALLKERDEIMTSSSLELKKMLESF